MSLGEGGEVFLIFNSGFQMKELKKIFLRWGVPGPMRSYIVKENLIDSAVRKILSYRQTDKHKTDKHPVTFI